MSQIAISGNASGTGVLTIASPNTNSNYTLTLPAATTTLAGTDATQSFTNKSFDSASVPTVSGTAPLYFCRAWVNFNGTGTVAIRASGNVSSITDNGVGNYTVNFTTGMSDTNYCPVTNTDTSRYTWFDTQTTSSVKVYCFTGGGSYYDPTTETVAIFR